MTKIKRGQSGISCLLGVNKPPNFTSHDIVNTVRKVFCERRVGHGGTLDPFATGVLPVMIGPATRLAQYFDGCKKEYIAAIKFGFSTITDDLTGQVLKTGTVTHNLRDSCYARSVLQDFVGNLKQTPPQFSAVQIDGVRAYSQARKGEEIELKPRDVVVYSADLLSIEDNINDLALTWMVRFVVGSGTYVRSLARDIGTRVGCPAHLHSLSRMAVGGISLSDSFRLEDLWEHKKDCTLDPCKVLPMLSYFIDESMTPAIMNGAPIKFNPNLVYEYVNGEPKTVDRDLTPGTTMFIVLPDKVLGVYALDEKLEMLRAETIFSVGVTRCHVQ